MARFSNLDYIQRVFTFDPGGTTGYAIISIDRARARVRISEVGEFQTWAGCKDLILYQAQTNKDAIVYEDFIIRTLAADTLALQVIGVIRYLCIESKVHCFPQQPHERLVIDKWLPNLAKDFPSHYGSAVRHGLLFMFKHLTGQKLWEVDYNKKELLK